MPAFSSANTDATNWNLANQLQRDLANDKKSRIIKDSQGTPVIILDSDGIRATAPGSGVSVLTATADQLLLNSAQPTLGKMYTTSITKAASSTGNTTPLAHGLTFKPLVIIQVENAAASGTWYPGPYHVFNTATGVLDGRVYASSDASNVMFRAETPSGTALFGSALTYNIRYWLLQAA